MPLTKAEQDKRYYEKHKTEINEKARLAYKKNPEKYKQLAREKYAKTRLTKEGRATHNAQTKKWHDEHPEYIKQYHVQNKEYISIDKEQNRQFKLNVINQWKGNGCQVCGFDDVRAIDAHHVNPDEKDKRAHSIYALAACSLTRLTQELAKCIPLCRNHHNILHHILREKPELTTEQIVTSLGGIYVFPTNPEL
jgi:hypothetical protein